MTIRSMIFITDFNIPDTARYVHVCVFVCMCVWVCGLYVDIRMCESACVLHVCENDYVHILYL